MFTREIIDDAFVIETARLELRWPRLADVRAIECLAGEKAVAEMTAQIPHPYPPGAAEAFVYEARHGNAEGKALTLVITPRGKLHEVMGAVSLRPSAAGEPEIGYWLGTPFWGCGFATEAVRAVVDTAFTHSDAPAVVASVRVVNPASRRVLEKCGFHVAGAGLLPFPARGGVFPVDHLRLERRIWESLKGWTNPHFVGLAVRERTAEAGCLVPGVEPCTILPGGEP